MSTLDRMDRARIEGLRDQALREVRDNILPFWQTKAVDRTHGGFFGHMAHDGSPDGEAAKGLVLNARLLWAFAHAYRHLGQPALLEASDRAYRFLQGKLRDPTHGGYYWTVDARGQPHHTHKQVYGQAFAVYALCEQYRATRDSQFLQDALQAAELVERHAHDDRQSGYLDAFTRDWRLAEDQRLSEVDMNEKKSNNTHLHLLEAYTSLAATDGTPWVRRRLRELVEVFLHRIIRPKAGHLVLFFGEDWTPKTTAVSYGHDIEASWLLCEAATVLGDGALTERVREAAIRLARLTLSQGMDTDGALVSQMEADGSVDRDKAWWPQAEAVVGFLNAYELTRQAAYLDAALRCWGFIQRLLVDPAGGEWHGRVRDGAVDTAFPKVSMWKCPYHNTRACFQIVDRADRMTAP